MSDKKASNGTVEQIIEHMTADLQNSDGQYIQLGFTPPPTPNDTHIWGDFPQNQMPQNPFVHFTPRTPENLSFDNRFVPQNYNYIPQNPIFVPEMPNNSFEKLNSNNFVVYPNPQFVMTNYIQREYNNQTQNDVFINQNNVPIQNRTHLIENLVGNWTPNTNGTYSPFGTINTSNFFENVGQNCQEIENPNLKLKTVKKQKQIAEVKPMRPTYSDVLTKSVPPKQEKIETITNKKHNQLKKTKTITKLRQNTSDKKDFDKNQTEKVNLSRKWVSLDDVCEKDYIKNDINDTQNNLKVKKNKKEAVKPEKPRKSFQDSNIGCQWTENEIDSDNVKNEEKNINKYPKKVKEPRTNSARQNKFTEKSPPSAKRAQRIRKKEYINNSFGIFGRNVQHYISRWSKIVFGCLIWFLNLVSDIFSMSAHLGRDLGTILWDNLLIYSKTISQNVISLLKRVKIFTKLAAYIDKTLGNSRFAFWNKWKNTENRQDSDPKSWLNSGLEHNINMPTTGEEAMKRLLACKGKDPYSILGVRADCTDDDIKRYYKRQAFLVHPDKNPQPGAEEAFKILVHAFDIIGEPERRQSYDRKVAESHQVEQAWSELNDLLSQLHQKMEYAANTIRCTNCNKRHRRVAVERPCYAARMCSQCKIHHSAKEGDIWAEATCWGFLWHYYACMDGSVYDITDWAGCQRKNLKHLRPNSHNVQYRIVLGKQAQQSPNLGQSPAGPRKKNREEDLENFLNNLYSQNDVSAAKEENPAKNRKKNKKKK